MLSIEVLRFTKITLLPKLHYFRYLIYDLSQ